MMDFKLKGIGWVGGIYQKFETLCHEVDNIVNKDTAKYVENQAQSVGKSMKRFYSDVIHDILPPSKHEGRGKALERSSTIDTHVKSKADIEEDHIDTVGKLSHFEPVAVDPTGKQLDHASHELFLSDQPSTSTSADVLDGAEADIMSGQVTDVLKDKSSHVNIEENVGMEKASGSDVPELISPSEEESFGATLGNEFIVSNNKNSCGFVGEVSLAISVHDTEFRPPKEEGTVNNSTADIMSGQVSDVLKDKSSHVSIEENAVMEKASGSDVPELISPSEEESFGASLGNEFIDSNNKNSCGVVGEVSLAVSVHDLEFRPPKEEGTVNNSTAADVVAKQLDCAFGELSLPDQQGISNSVDSLQGKEYVTSEQGADFLKLKDTKPEVNTEENATLEKPLASEVSELIPPVEKESCGAFLLGDFIDCNDKEPCSVEVEVSLKMLDHDLRKLSASDVSEVISPGEDESLRASLVHKFVNYNKNPCPSWVEAEVSIAMSNHDVRKLSVSDVSEVISPGEKESPGDSLVHEFVNYNKNPCVFDTDVSPATLVHGDQIAETVENDFADDSECVLDVLGGITSSIMTSSVINCEENIAEAGVNSSCGLISRGIHLCEDSTENLPAKAFVSPDPVDVVELVSHNVLSSSMLTPLLSDEKLTRASSTSSSHDLSVESLENDAPRTFNDTNSLTGISTNTSVYLDSESGQLQALSSADLGCTDESTDDISISSMETVELCDEAKLDNSCVIVDSAALYAVSHIMRKHRSFKKKIQDALTSKKRLAKEYEQLAIWFGDADMGSNDDYLQILQPSSSTTALECKNLQTELVCDSEWELL